MQKSYVFTVATILLAVANISTMTMEHPLINTEKTIINVDLELTKGKRLFHRYDKRDKHYCEILGIAWEENNNTYIVNNAWFKDPGETDNLYWCWTEEVPTNLPDSTKANPFYPHKDIQYAMNKFPYTLPNTFVEKLKKETTITLTNTLFAEPVEIIIHLKPIENDTDTMDTSTASNIESSLVTKERQTFIVDLYVGEKTQEDMDTPRDHSHDKHACEVLGISWEENNKYKTHNAFLYDINDPSNSWSWDCFHPTFLPLSTKPNSKNFKDMENTVFFPKFLPTEFVEQLKEEGSITLEHASFQKPVTIIIKLGENNSNKNVIKEFPSTPTEILPIEETTHNLARESKTETKPTSYKKIYIFTGLTAGIIAYILYLYRNNQLNSQLFSIPHFIHNLTSKNSSIY